MHATGGRRLAGGLLAVLLAATSASPAWAAETQWKRHPGTTGDWFVTDNWDNGVPTSSDRAYIDNGGTVLISSGVAARDTLYVGHENGGQVIQTGGSSNSLTRLRLAEQPGSEGSYEMSGGSLTVKVVRIGVGGRGHMKHTGGQITIDEDHGFPFYVGAGGEYGLYELSGSAELSTLEMGIGWKCPGEVRQTGGRCTVGEWLMVGVGDAGTGTYNLSGGLLAVPENATSLTDGDVFRQSGGTSRHSLLAARPGSLCELTGGTFEVNLGGRIEGVWDFAGGTGRVEHRGGILDITDADIRDPIGTTYRGYDSALLIHAPDFNPAAAFGSFDTNGFTHVQGETLTIPGGKSVKGQGTIVGHVRVAGTLVKNVYFWPKVYEDEPCYPLSLDGRGQG